MSSSCLPKCACNGLSIWDTLKPQERAGEAWVRLRDVSSFPAWVHKGAQEPTNLLSLWAWLHVVFGPMETRASCWGWMNLCGKHVGPNYDSLQSLLCYFPFPRCWHQAVCSALNAAAELVAKKKKTLKGKKIICVGFLLPFSSLSCCYSFSMK